MKVGLSLGLATIGAVVAMSISTPAFAIPSSWSLNVPERGQAMPEWCWAASDESILVYYGRSVIQCDIYKYVKNSSTCTGNDPASDAEAQRGLAHWSVSSTRLTTSVSFSTIQSQVYNGKRPIYAGWSSSTETVGHAVVIDGYDTISGNYVEYMDPADDVHYLDSYTWFAGGAGSGANHVWDGTLYQMVAS